ncbi:MAG: YkgJ family cysteine cluster protein [Promethearchaeota archaeon]
MELLEDVKDGFYFKCKLCGRCCTGKDEGFVFLFRRDILNIANFLQKTLDDFLDNYVEVIETTFRLFDPKSLKYKNKIFILKALVLKQDKDTGRCIFLQDDNKCLIYQYRPYQCRAWPLWYSNMTKSEHFHNAKSKCPGFKVDIDNLKNRQNYFITVEKIKEIIREEMRIEVEYIKKMKKYNQNFRKVFPYLKKVKYKFKIEYPY